MRILRIGFDCYGADTLYGKGHQWAGVDVFCECVNGAMIQHDLRMYPDVEHALDDFEPELVLLGVNNLSKNPVDIECAVIERGIPIVINKLRLRSMADYDALRAAAKAGSAPVWIGEFYRLNPVVHTARGLIERGVFGCIEQLVYQCFIDDSRVHPWMRAYRELALEDLAFHHYSVLHALTGLDGDVLFAYSRTPEKAGGATGSVCGASIVLRSGAYIEHTIHWLNTMRNTDYFGSLSIDGTLGGLLIENGRLFHRHWGDAHSALTLIAPPFVNVPQHAVEYLRGRVDESPLSLEAFEPVMTALRKSLKLAGCDR